MITREQVADLRPGDVVELRKAHWPEGTVIRGPLYLSEGRLECGSAVVRWSDGGANSACDVTVISRAPRPLYVNHDRTEPVPGDVVRDADSDSPATWMYRFGGGCPWIHAARGSVVFGSAKREVLPDRLRLLVDGETGQVVP